MRRIYEFRVEEQLSESWTQAFDGLELIRCADGEMVLRGVLPDQAALHGTLTRIRDLGLTLLSVHSSVTSDGSLLSDDSTDRMAGRGEKDGNG